MLSRRHVHFRISEREYQFLAHAATLSESSLTDVIRRLIRSAMKSQETGHHQAGPPLHSHKLE